MMLLCLAEMTGFHGTKTLTVILHILIPQPHHGN